VILTRRCPELVPQRKDWTGRTKATLPVLGACMPVADLAHHAAWLAEDARDLEIQDFCNAEVLNGDWRGRVKAARALMSGHRGRLGIHGLFWGFSIASKDPDVRALVRRRMVQALDAAAELGATQMVMHSPYTTWDHNHLGADAAARAGIIALAQDSQAPAVRRAEALGGNRCGPGRAGAVGPPWRPAGLTGRRLPSHMRRMIRRPPRPNSRPGLRVKAGIER
jgi:hypothetical protein